MLTSSENLREEAFRQFESGDVRGALRTTLAALSTAPASPWPYLLMGRCYAQMERGRWAVACCERFLELLPRGISPESRRHAETIIIRFKGEG